ncbi:MAG: hypothetical protein KAU28_11260 [Phycisphaerae bacterium]|nr:hypothetical protein [Phycisphaerae bacterium]
MTKLTMRTLIVAAMLAIPACAADTDTPTDSPSQQSAAAEETHSTVSPSPRPPDYADALDIIEKVDSFYNNAWLKLMGLVAVGGVVIGVVLPIVLERRQSRSFESAKADYSEGMATLGNDLRAEIKQGERDNAAKGEELMGAVRTELNQAKTELEAEAGKTRVLLLTEGFSVSWTLFRILAKMPDMIPNAIAAGATTINQCVELESPTDTTESFIKELVQFLRAEGTEQALASNELSCQGQVRKLIEVVDRMEKTHSLRQLLGELGTILLNAQTGADL